MKLKFLPRDEFYGEFSLSDKERLNAAPHLADDQGENELRYSYFAGCLLTRLFTPDVGYYFWPAVALRTGASLKRAYAAISEYAMLEAIKEVYVDMPRGHAAIVARGRPYAVVTRDEWDEGDGGGDTSEEKYIVEIETECTLAEDIPEIMVDDVLISEFFSCYAEDYERLVRDKSVNQYFGYSYLDDNEDGTGADFIAMAREQFDRGEAMNFAATVLSDDKNLLIGEGTLYGFDGRLGASFSLRLLPEWQGKGYGKKLLYALVLAADGLGLNKLYADIDERNIASLGLVSRVGRASRKRSGTVYCTVDVKRALKSIKSK